MHARARGSVLGRTVIGTGGSGIGPGAALALAAEGANVAVADIRPYLAETVVENIHREGGGAPAIASARRSQLSKNKATPTKLDQNKARPKQS